MRPDRLWGPASLLSNGHSGMFSRGEVAGSEADHNFAEIKNGGAIPPLPHISSLYGA
jgi:hypothetical protein